MSIKVWNTIIKRAFIGSKINEDAIKWVCIFTLPIILHLVAHAEDQVVEKEELDRATQGYLVQNVRDIKQAQVSQAQSCWIDILKGPGYMCSWNERKTTL